MVESTKNFQSPNQASLPRQPIRRIRPTDPRSPFYDSSGGEMKPLARLYLSRQRLYEKICDSSRTEDKYEDGDTCETEEWSAWSPCSATCGRGVKYKQRRYRNEASKYVCRKKLTERAGCEALQKYCPHQPTRPIEDPLCELGEWSSWSSCSVTCGKGVKTRDRKYKNRMAAKSCAVGKTNPPKMQENLECWAEKQCDDLEEIDEDEDCPEKMWSDWSPCSVTCGKGFKVRYEMSIGAHQPQMYWPFLTNHKTDEEFDDEEDVCSRRAKETVECLQKPCGNDEKSPDSNIGFVVIILAKL